MKKLFVIAGHGAGDSGAVGHGYTEAERVRALAKRIKELGGANVMLGDLNRNYYADNGISKLNLSKEYAICELHMDSGAPSAKGGHIIIKAGVGGADQYDKALANFLNTMFPGRASIIVERSDLANPNRAYAKGYNYRLAECGFISNKQDLQMFNTRMDDLARGILRAFGIETAPSQGWQKDATGWWYKNADGSYQKNQWLYDNNVWYYFNEKGYMVHNGWRKIEEKWYYFEDNGAMVHSGWRQIENYWYFFKTNGSACCDEWNLQDGNWSYFDSDCHCLMDRWLEHKKHWYYLDSKGYALKGIHEIDYHIYEFALENCEMIEGFIDHDGIKYFYNDGAVKTRPVGALVTSQGFTYKGKEYEADSQGKVRG